MDQDQVRVLEAARLFDADWYRRNSPDFSLSGGDPISHYLSVGWYEGRNPFRLFDGAWYLAENLDVLKAGVNPLIHYIQWGEAEGRWPCRIFDPCWYSKQYGVQLGHGRAFAHYLTVGCGQELQPNEIFDPTYYRLGHDDIRNGNLDPALHYLEVGFREDRNVAPGFCLKKYRDRYLGGEVSIDPVYHYLRFGRARGCHFSSSLETPPSIAREVRLFTNPGPEFEEFHPALLESKIPRAKLIAFYLPQFHSIPENDAWWGKGFTEWRNTQRGLPRFVGHYQPRVPRDLGFYDLANSSVLRRQIEMARQAGIYGFCFYYYNFGGNRVLEQPIESFLSDHSLDFPFCLMWANENWTRRWDGAEDDVLLRQSYRRQDEDALLGDWCRHFADPRYMKVAERPLFLIYRPGSIPDARQTIARWRRKLAQDFGQHPWLLMSQSFGEDDPTALNLDGAFEFPPHKLAEGLPSINASLAQLDPSFTGTVVSYEQVVERSLSGSAPAFPLIKALCPSWDNDCRRQGAGFTLHGSTPYLYQRWLASLVRHARAHPFANEPLVFLNAWNEWAEAAYLEPDVHYGAAYLNATARALADSEGDNQSKPSLLLVGHDAHRHGAQLNFLHLGRQLTHKFGVRVAWLLLEGGALLNSYREIGSVTIARPGSSQMSNLLQQLRGEGCRYAITNTLVTGSTVPDLRLAGFRVLSLIHELTGLATEYKLQAEAKAIADGSDIIVCAATIVEQAFRRFGGKPRGTVRILPQGLYLDLGDQSDLRQTVRMELGLSSDTKIVIGVGYADVRKGADLFSQAAEIAATYDPKMFFLWIGDKAKNVEHLFSTTSPVEALPNLRQIDYTDSVARYYHAADAMFLSSREDPFPSVVLEALACGLPVVGFAECTGTEDLLREHGAVVPAFDVAAAVRELHRLLTLERETSAAAAAARRKMIERNFDYDRFAFSILRLLNSKWRPVSVIVPNYNYARYLNERFESIIAQTVPIFEIIILDDGSTDSSVAVIEGLRKQYKRDFILIRNETNSGSSINQWLRGLERASGDLVWIAEADDISDPKYLERLLPAFEDEQTLFAFSDSAQIDGKGLRIGNSYHSYYERCGASALFGETIMDARSFGQRFLTVQNLILNVSAVLAQRKALLDTIGENIEQLRSYRFAGDWHIYALVCLRGGRVAYVAEPLNIHRRHMDSATHLTTGAAHIGEIENVHAFLEKAYASDDQLRIRRRQYVDELNEQFGLCK